MDQEWSQAQTDIGNEIAEREKMNALPDWEGWDDDVMRNLAELTDHTTDRPDVIVVMGSPTDGFSYWGPFFSDEDAIEWAESVDVDWWITTLQSPDEDVVM